MEINLAIIDFNPGQGGGVKPSGTLDISENGVYNVYAYASASVDVHPSISLSETYISNGSYNITGEFNGGVITVDVPAPQFVTETLNVSANGTYTPGEGVDGYSQVVVDVPQSVTGYTEKDVTEGKLNIVNLNNSASFVKNNVFGNNSYIQTVDLPDCYEVKEAAFGYCANLTTVNLPMCSSIGSAVFRNCSSLSQVNLPTVKTIGQVVFNNCTSLTSLTLCTDVYWTIPFGTRTYGGTPIVNESSSASIYVRSDTYSLWISSNDWSSISSKFVSVPVSGPALSFSNGLVSGTTKAIESNFTSYLSVSKSDINNVLLPECKYIYNQTFQSCTSLNQVNLPVCSYIGDGAFLNCNLFSSMTIGYSGVCSLGGSNVFSNTQITSSTGSIYVPTSLVDSYKSAPNWSYFSTQIFPIE